MTDETRDILCRNKMIQEGGDEHAFDNLSEEAKDIRRREIDDLFEGIAGAMMAIGEVFNTIIKYLPEVIVEFSKKITWDTECLIPEGSGKCFAHHYELVSGICPNKAMTDYVLRYEAENSENS